MPEIPRLNGVIRALAQGQIAFVGFAPADVETATALASSNLDGVAFEMEHAPMSAPALLRGPGSRAPAGRAGLTARAVQVVGPVRRDVECEPE